MRTETLVALAISALVVGAIARSQADTSPVGTATASATAFPCPTYAGPARRTPSPEQESASLRQYSQYQTLLTRPAKIPYAFILTGDPAVRRDSIRFSLRDEHGQLPAERVHLLGTVPESIIPPNPCSHTSEFTAGFALDTAGLPSGRYWLTVSALEDPVTLPDGEVFQPKVPPREDRLYLPPRPDSVPELRLGQRFLVFPGASKNERYVDEDGHELERSQIIFHTATLASIDENKLVFAVSGTSFKIVEPSNLPVTAIPGLPPLVEDPVVKELERRFAGKGVWGRGQTGAECVVDIPGSDLGGGGPGVIPSPIHHVFRIYQSNYLRLGHSAGEFYGSGDSEIFMDGSPLVVWLDVPKLKGQVLPAIPAFGPFPGVGQRQCIATYAIFADGWDLDRSYSASAPPAGLPKTIQPGMTHEEVAWLQGYPPAYGTRAELDRLQVWRFHAALVSSFWVYFDQNGHVTTTKTNAPAQLP